MSAPSEQKDNQKEHHIRSQLCMTRAKYREGRELKAVKVYTITHESKYLLIQGVPTLGAGQELLRAFSAFGTVDEHRLLKDYPTEAFTEVYLIKFQKIQSARIAKRKLDDFSFFGGVLHVCYAPEYETLQETRDKLQDRRKAVARRLKEIELEKPKLKEDKNSMSAESIDQSSSSDIAADERSKGSSSVDHIPGPNAADCDGHTTVPVYPNEAPCNERVPALPPATLPPPPRPMPPWFRPHPPSGHYPMSAQIPPWMQRPLVRQESFRQHLRPPHNFPSTKPNRIQQSLSSKIPDKNTKNLPKTIGQPSVEGHFLPRKVQEHLGKSENKLLHKNGKIMGGNEVIIKEYTKKGTKPSFVPRQASRKVDILAKRTNPASDEFRITVKDAVNESLRKNAFILDEMKGPMLPMEEESKRKNFQNSETGSHSLDSTVQDIREKVNKFTTNLEPPRAKRPKTS